MVLEKILFREDEISESQLKKEGYGFIDSFSVKVNKTEIINIEDNQKYLSIEDCQERRFRSHLNEAKVYFKEIYQDLIIRHNSKDSIEIYAREF